MFKLSTDFDSGEKLRAGLYLDSLGLFFIGIFCLGYGLFVRRFAELHLQLPFLDFPIFIGEILLFICLILLFLKYKLNPQKLQFWHYCLFFYLTFILTKAFWGYFEWGPLAFRHAALFYYPLFAVFGHGFYRKGFFKGKGSVALGLLIILIIGLLRVSNLFLLPCLIFLVVLIKQYPNKVTRYLLFILLFIVVPYERFFFTSRTMLVANLVAGIYIMFALLFVLKIKKSYKISFSLVVAIFLSVGLFMRLGDKNVKSFVNLGALVKQYKAYDQIIARGVVDPGKKKRIEKVNKENKVKLYNPEVSKKKELKAALNFPGAKLSVQEFSQERRREEKQRIERLQQEAEKAQKVVDRTQKETEEIELSNKAMQFKRSALQTIINQAQKKIEENQKEIEEFKLLNLKSYPSPVLSHDRMPNVFFRLFIWRDMLKELKEQKPFFGFSFGKPLRSRSIETLYWAVGEWSRDGWIAVHNSYLEIIYRAGVLGIIFIGIIISLLLKITVRSIELKSLSGVLLCAALINWAAAAFFLVILELPYTAIPFWALLGMNYASLNKTRQ